MTALRALGARAGYTLGSMSEGSATLTLATAAHPFRVGHTVIVEVGGEAGAGARATVGVGGTWPATSYADAATLIASGEPPATSDGSDPAAYAEDTGDVYYWDGDEWLQPDSSLYHWRKFWPLALVAVVDAVDGATLTLDTASTVATTDARVWCDSWRVFADGMHIAGLSIDVPAGVYAISEAAPTFGSAMGASVHDAVTISGAGVASELRSPGGCSTMQLYFPESEGVSISGLLLRTNVGDDGGMNGDEGFDPSVVILRPIYIEDSANVSIENVRVVGCEWAACELANCTGSAIRDCYAENTTPRHYYTGVWNFTLSGCTDCHAYDCTSDGDYIHIAAEMFRSTDCTIERLTTRNGQVSSNGSVNPWYYDLTMTFEVDSAIPAAYDGGAFTSNQTIAWTNNISNPSAGGGGISGLTWRQTGDLGEGHTWDMVVSRSATLPAGSADITFEDFDIDSGGRLDKSIVALDSGAGTSPELHLNNIVADAGIDLDVGSISNTAAPVLRYDSGTTTLGSGNTIPDIQDVL